MEGSSNKFQSHLRTSSFNIKPAWLVSSLADLDHKIRTLVLNSEDDKYENQADVTFAQKAEFYYQQRPQLLSLLQDLYETYLSLADRHCQSLNKHHHQQQQHYASTTASSSDLLSVTEDYQSDAESSSLSYQLPPMGRAQSISFDETITELVMKNVEYDLVVHEVLIKERRAHESSRKIELQRSLLEVLESERLIVLSENAGLRYKVSALVEENKELASESMFMKRKAGELARIVFKMRDDHRVCLMSRKIEDLQGKIYGLEKRNREYCKKLSRREKSKMEGSSARDEGGEGVVVGSVVYEKGVGILKWWHKVKNFDILFLCKPNNPK